MKKKEYEEKAKELVLPIVDENNIELVDIEYIKEKTNNYLRVFIEKDGGVDINDCEIISRRLSDKLDEFDFIVEEYILEVSSPGDHPFKSERDYERNINNYISVKTYEAINGEKKFLGELKENNEDNIVLLTDNGEINILKEKIAKANVDFKL